MRLYLYRFLIIVLSLIALNHLNAQNNKMTSSQSKAEDVMTLDFDKNLNIPKIKDKYKSNIIAHQKKLGEQFIKQGYKVETIRKGEVLIISIPAHDLFAPNNISLLESASIQLQPILSLVKNKMYKLLVAMHSDDTGSEQYQDMLTNNRIVAVYEWIKDNAHNTTTIVPYAMGNSEPIEPNNSRVNRQKNRRLEIYVVPAEQMIERSKGNNL